MRISRWSPCIIIILLFTGGTFVIAGADQLERQNLKGKDALHDNPGENNPFAVLHLQPENSKCLEECFRRNQMASVGVEIIQEQCRQECNLENILALLKSSQTEDYVRGVKALSEFNDPRVVQPLIIALKRDIKERRGLWAWIIPALGALKDPDSVSILTYTLNLRDDDWLGREMSAKALGSIGDPSAVPHLLAAAWYADTRDVAIETLVNFRDKRSIPVFLSALDPAEEKETREAAFSGLQILGSDAIPQILEAFIDFSSEHPETEKRFWLCQLLSSSNDARAHEMLRISINDPEKIIRECAELFFQSQK